MRRRTLHRARGRAHTRSARSAGDEAPLTLTLFQSQWSGVLACSALLVGSLPERRSPERASLAVSTGADAGTPHTADAPVSSPQPNAATAPGHALGALAARVRFWMSASDRTAPARATCSGRRCCRAACSSVDGLRAWPCALRAVLSAEDSARPPSTRRRGTQCRYPLARSDVHGHRRAARRRCEWTQL